MSNIDPLSKDYYKRFGLTKNATSDQIRRSYKKLCKKYHPDISKEKNAEENFKSIQAAYEVLNDANKRDVYDQFGEEGLKGGGGGGGFPFSGMGGSFFGDLFGDGGGGGSSFFGGRGGRQKQQRKAQTVQKLLSCKLEDVYNGKVRRIKITRKRICKKCKGKGSKNEKLVKKCSKCKGRGKIEHRQQTGNFIQIQTTVCHVCRGNGESIDEKDKCVKCKGEKVVDNEKVLEINIDKGMKTGEKIMFEGDSDEYPDVKAGDIMFVLKVLPHETFKRDGDDLEMVKRINLAEALTGTSFLVKHMDDRTLYISNNDGEIISPLMVKQIVGEGLPRFKHPFEKGNLNIKFEIDFPERIPKSIHKKLLDILPKKTNVKKKKEYEDYKLTEPIKTKNGNNQKRKEAYDEDDEGDFRRTQQGCVVQ